MRKDVKLAFVVGGILISVLVVYVLVVPGGQKRSDKQAVVLDGDRGAEAPAPAPADKTAAAAVDNKSGDNRSGDNKPSDNKSGDNSKSIGQSADAAGAAQKSAEPKSSDTSVAEGATTKPTDPFASASGNSADQWMAALNRGSVPMMTTAPPAPTPAMTPTIVKTQSARTSSGTPSQTPPALQAAAPVSPVTMENTPSTRPSNATARGDGRTHVVAKGETLAKIAEAAYGSQNYWPYIIRANPGMVAEKIRPGMTINLPAESDVKGSATLASSTASADATAPKADTTSPKVDAQSQYEVQSGDSLHKIAMKLYGSSAKWQAIYDLNKEAIGADPAKVKVKSILKLPEPPTVKQ